MSDAIDWMTPISAGSSSESLPLYGSAPAGTRFSHAARQSLAGVREEQLRRARILEKAANGAKITKGNAKAVIERLARVVPGLRYKVGLLVYSTLAPPERAAMPLYGAGCPGDDLPGRHVGRPPRWTPDVRAELVAWVDQRMKATGEPAATAVIAYGDELAAAGMFPPSAKTLANQLAKGRREASIR